MKRSTLILTVMLCVSWALLPVARGQDQKVPGPQMHIPEKNFDVGEVMEGDVIEHTFKVFNRGDRTLTIKDVRPG